MGLSVRWSGRRLAKTTKNDHVLPNECTEFAPKMVWTFHSAKKTTRFRAAVRGAYGEIFSRLIPRLDHRFDLPHDLRQVLRQLDYFLYGGFALHFFSFGKC